MYIILRTIIRDGVVEKVPVGKSTDVAFAMAMCKCFQRYAIKFNRAAVYVIYTYADESDDFIPLDLSEHSIFGDK
jgi:hypothetical protein